MQRTYTTLPYTEYTTTIYDDNRKPITNIIIHSTVCTVQQAINTFSSPNATTSAHYIIGNDGKLWAGLEEYEVGYHCGNYEMNQKSIGIEHEWYSGLTISDALYSMSAKLVADICKFYNLPCNRTTVKMHKEIVPTGCPNLIDTERIVREANTILNGGPIVDDCPAKLKEKTELETFLRGEIEKKDIQLQTIPSILAEKNSLAVQLDSCQRDTATYKEAYDKLPELTENIKYLEGLKAEWTTKEQGYVKRIKYLETKIEKIKTPIKTLLVEILEALKK